MSIYSISFKIALLYLLHMISYYTVGHKTFMVCFFSSPNNRKFYFFFAFKTVKREGKTLFTSISLNSTEFSGIQRWFTSVLKWSVKCVSNYHIINSDVMTKYFFFEYFIWTTQNNECVTWKIIKKFFVKCFGYDLFKNS